MSNFRYPGPICQMRDWFQDIEDGTLVRARSSAPSNTGASPAPNRSSRPAQDGGGDCAFLNPRSTGTVLAPQAAFDRLRVGVTCQITAARSGAAQPTVTGSSTATVEQEIIVGGHTIHIIRPPEAETTGRNLPTTDQLAIAVRAIPANQRRHTTRIVITLRRHPQSSSTQTVAGEAGGGEITLFPVNGTQTQNDFDNRLMHESGHNYQGSVWDSDAAVHEWRVAAAADNRIPSPYAGGNTGDDFCEFGILFNAARGTPCERTALQLYPHRWAKMIEYESR